MRRSDVATTTAWQVPRGLAGDASAIRVSSPVISMGRGDCPTWHAVKAHPKLHEADTAGYVRKTIEDFPLGPLMRCLDLVEHHSAEVGAALDRLTQTHGRFADARRPPAHPGLLAWTADAVPRYLAARGKNQSARQQAGLEELVPVNGTWRVIHWQPTPDARGVRRYELPWWGRGYRSADGRERELWLPTYSPATHDRTAAEIALAAYVCGLGRLDDQQISAPRHATDPEPDRVKVVGVNCLTGMTRTLCDWDLDEVRRRYERDAAPVLSQIVAGDERVPGTNCVDCLALAGCSAVSRQPGILPVGPPSRSVRRPRRTVSAWDLRVHQTCPARYHMYRQLKLRTATVSTAESDEVRRGRAVDAWLADSHRRGDRPARGCRALPGPVDPADWSAGGHHLTGDVARVGAEMIAQHRTICPLDGLAAGEQVDVTRRLTVYDPDLDTLVVATPDLMYTQVGVWVWRETKTTRSMGKPYGGSVLRAYPQLAFAVVLIASGVLGVDPAQSRVELEILQPDDCALEELDPGMAATVDEARNALAELVVPWAGDVDFPPRPSRRCHDCEVTPWCAAGQSFLAGATVTAGDRA